MAPPVPECLSQEDSGAEEPATKAPEAGNDPSEKSIDKHHHAPQLQLRSHHERSVFAEILVRLERTRYQRLVCLICRGLAGEDPEPELAKKKDEASVSDRPVGDSQLRLRVRLEADCLSRLELSSASLHDAVTAEPVWQEHCLFLLPGYEVKIETDVDFVDGSNQGEMVARLKSRLEESVIRIPVKD